MYSYTKYDTKKNLKYSFTSSTSSTSSSLSSSSLSVISSSSMSSSLYNFKIKHQQDKLYKRKLNTILLLKHNIFETNVENFSTLVYLKKLRRRKLDIELFKEIHLKSSSSSTSSNFIINSSSSSTTSLNNNNTSSIFHFFDLPQDIHEKILFEYLGTYPLLGYFERILNNKKLLNYYYYLLEHRAMYYNIIFGDRMLYMIHSFLLWIKKRKIILNELLSSIILKKNTIQILLESSPLTSPSSSTSSFSSTISSFNAIKKISLIYFNNIDLIIKNSSNYLLYLQLDWRFHAVDIRGLIEILSSCNNLIELDIDAYEFIAPNTEKFFIEKKNNNKKNKKIKYRRIYNIDNNIINDDVGDDIDDDDDELEENEKSEFDTINDEFDEDNIDDIDINNHIDNYRRREDIDNHSYSQLRPLSQSNYINSSYNSTNSAFISSNSSSQQMLISSFISTHVIKLTENIKNLIDPSSIISVLLNINPQLSVSDLKELTLDTLPTLSFSLQKLIISSCSNKQFNSLDYLLKNSPNLLSLTCYVPSLKTILPSINLYCKKLKDLNLSGKLNDEEIFLISKSCQELEKFSGKTSKMTNEGLKMLIKNCKNLKGNYLLIYYIFNIILLIIFL